ncbi:MAG: flagellar biosynthesis protein FlhB [Bacillota bacterium]
MKPGMCPDRLTINLQLFGEKTEKPTAKKRQKAREKGQVLKSPEINSVIILILSFLALKFFTPYMFDQMADVLRYSFNQFGNKGFELNIVNLRAIFLAVILATTKALVPVVGFAMLGGLAASYAQVGFLFTTEPMAFKFERINPVEGFKRLFSLRSFVEALKSVAKVMIIGYAAYSVYKAEFTRFPYLIDLDIRSSIVYLGQLIMRMAYKVALYLAILAVLDYLYQRWQHEKSLKMEKQEVKDEFKQQEGDPQIRGKIKQKQREVSMRRMMQELPKADVVITNPTHYAVALQYNAETMGAPVVIAKGQDMIALKIKQVATEHNVTIVENKPLAQSLYKTTEIGDVIPADLYQAVAEVLAFVYKLKGKI